jgi:glycosyltransferase 2 family protein
MRRPAIALAGLLVSAAAVIIVISTIDVGEAVGVLARTNPLPLVTSIGVVAFQVGLRAFRWRTILPAGGDGRPIPVPRLVPPLLVGYLGNAILPARLGEPMRAVLVSRRERVGMPESLASVVLERITDVATLAVVALLAALIVGAPPWIVNAAALAGAAGIAILVVLATSGVGPLVGLLQRLPLFGRKPRLTAGLEQLERFASTLGGGHRRRVILGAAGISLVAWLLDGMTFWLAAQALDVELTYVGAILVSGIAVLGTAVPSAPGYVGTFELAAAAVATSLGVPGEEALALALVAHAVTLLSLALGGAMSLVLIGTGLGEAVHAAKETRVAAESS